MADAPLCRTTPCGRCTCELAQLPRRRRPRHGAPPAARQRRRHFVLGGTRPQSSELYRNAAGDEVVFVAQAARSLESVFGTPRGRSRRLRGDPGVDDAPLGGRRRRAGADARPRGGRSRAPSRRVTCTSTGQLREGAPYCERDLAGPPEDRSSSRASEVPVLIRHRAGGRATCHARHPFDVVGWDGCVYPFAFSIRRLRADRRAHPPAAAGPPDLRGPNFVVCSFVPRPYDFDPEAIRVPYHHANVDSDEVLFYVEGDFMSRKGAGIGAARSRCTRPDSCTVPSRVASRRRRSESHRRDRGDGRHVPPARGDKGGARGLGRDVLEKLDEDGAPVGP